MLCKLQNKSFRLKKIFCSCNLIENYHENLLNFASMRIREKLCVKEFLHIICTSTIYQMHNEPFVLLPFNWCITTIRCYNFIQVKQFLPTHFLTKLCPLDIANNNADAHILNSLVICLQFFSECMAVEFIRTFWLLY